jgi:excisionase family DNA binding protein
MKDTIPAKKTYHSEEEIPLFLTVEDVANVLKISTSFAYHLFYEEDFPAIKLGSRRIVHKEKLFKWLDKHKQSDINHVL